MIPAGPAQLRIFCNSAINEFSFPSDPMQTFVSKDQNKCKPAQFMRFCRLIFLLRKLGYSCSNRRSPHVRVLEKLCEICRERCSWMLK